MNIVVLAGGLSTERDVSFVSGGQIAEALRKNGHQVIMLDVFMGYKDEEEKLDKEIFSHGEEYSVKVSGISTEAPDIRKIKASRKDQSDCFFGPNVIQICRLADVVFMALHGSNGEDGRIQAAFDLFGIPYTGSGYLGSAISMDKNTTKIFLKDAGVPTPQSIRIDKGQEQFEDLLNQIHYPCVVKPLCGGSSIGVSIVEDIGGLQEALKDAFFWEDSVLVEDYIKGREFSIGVISGRALPVIEIAPIQGFYDYKNKYQEGSTVETCPAAISPKKTKEMQQYAEMAADAVGLDKYCRIDFMMNADGGIYCLEINTLPGMTPTSLLPQEAAVEGCDFAALCEKLIQISLEKKHA